MYSRMLTSSYYRFMWMLLTVCITRSISLAVPNPAHKSRVIDKPLSDKQHFNGKDHNEHNVEFDHDAFLGKEEAKKFDSMSPTESQEQLRLIFVKIDKNGDERISEEELKDWMRQVQINTMKTETRKQWKDVNPTNKEFLTWEEYEKHAWEDDEADAEMIARDHRKWEIADVDHNSLLSFEEFHSFVHPESVEHMKEYVIQETMEDVDTDKDGRISFQEYITDAAHDADDEDGENAGWDKEEEEEFKLELDKNNDSYLDYQEIRDWIIPNEDEHIMEETKHLFREGDFNTDGYLSVEEVVNSYDLFAGSSATDYGDMLTKDEL